VKCLNRPVKLPPTGQAWDRRTGRMRARRLNDNGGPLLTPPCLEVSAKLKELWPDAKGTSQPNINEILSEMGKSSFPIKPDLAKGHSPEELAKRATPDKQVRRSAHDSSGQDILVAQARGGEQIVPNFSPASMRVWRSRMARVSYAPGVRAFLPSFEGILCLCTQVSTVLNGTPNSSATTFIAFRLVGCL